MTVQLWSPLVSYLMVSLQHQRDDVALSNLPTRRLFCFASHLQLCHVGVGRVGPARPGETADHRRREVVPEPNEVQPLPPLRHRQGRWASVAQPKR